MTSGGKKTATIDHKGQREMTQIYQAIEMIKNKPEGRILATGDYDYVLKFWIAEKVAICHTISVEIKRLSPETLEKRRTTRAKNKVMKSAPLFFDEFFKRELSIIKSKVAPV